MNWEDDNLDQTLQSLRDEPLSESALAEVRSRVRLRIEQRSSRRWWLWLPVPALAGVLMVILLWPGGRAANPNRTATVKERIAQSGSTASGPLDHSRGSMRASTANPNRTATVKERIAQSGSTASGPPDHSRGSVRTASSTPDRTATVKERIAQSGSTASGSLDHSRGTQSGNPLDHSRGSMRASTAGPDRTATVKERVPDSNQETQFVKLMTDDPDVVILWAIDRTGDSQ